MNIIAYIITFLLFIGPVVLSLLGWTVEGDMTSHVKYYPAFYILLVFTFSSLFNNSAWNKYNKIALLIVFITIIYFSTTRLLLGRKISSMVLLNSMSLPAMYFLFWHIVKEKYKKGVLNTILTLFIANNLLAIYERFSHTLFFPFDLIRKDLNMAGVEETDVFRSTALLAHPLSNALIMSIVMSFILLSDMKTNKKYTLYFIGLIGIFCFNARAAIIISVLIFALYHAKRILSDNTSMSVKILSILLAVVTVIFIKYLFDIGLAGRFAERGNFAQDDSALQRLYVWMLFQKYDISYFLWGLPGDMIQKMTLSAYGSRYVENWFIASTLSVGLIITISIILLFIPLFKSAVKPFSKYNSFLLIFTCIGLASTNNSLACGVPAIATFFTCCYAFGNSQNTQN